MYTATITVTDSHGVSDTTTEMITVNFNVVGDAFKQPVNDTRHNQVPSIFKHGSTIPLKLEVTDCNGSHPTNLVIKIYWQKMSGGVPQGQLEAVATNSPDTGNVMRVVDSHYMFNWNTKLATDPTLDHSDPGEHRGDWADHLHGYRAQAVGAWGGQARSACPPPF